MSYKTAVSLLSRQVEDFGSGRRNSAHRELFPDDWDRVQIEWAPKATIPQLEELREVLAEVMVETVIAGGAVLGSKEGIEFSDVDIFPTNPKALAFTKEYLECLGYKQTDRNEYLSTWKHKAAVYVPIQLIEVHLDTGCPYKILGRFDLTLCQVGIYKGSFISFARSLKDIDSRLIRVQSTLSVDNLIQRIEKYKKRGFRTFDGEK